MRGRKQGLSAGLPGTVAAVAALMATFPPAARSDQPLVYVVQFAQSGNATAFPDLARFLTYSIRLRISQVPLVRLAAADRDPCARPAARDASPDAKDNAKNLDSAFYAIRGSVEVHAPEQGPGAEVLVSYGLSKGDACQTVSPLRTDKFPLSGVLDVFGSIAEKLATDLSRDVRPPIRVDIFPVSVTGGGKAAPRAASLLGSYLNFRLSGVDDIVPQTRAGDDSKPPGDFGLKSEIVFSPDGTGVQGQVRFVAADNAEYPPTVRQGKVPKNNADEALADFVLGLASAAAGDLGWIRAARQSGADQISDSNPGALIARAKALLCEAPAPSADPCVKQPREALAALGKIRKPDTTFNVWELTGRAHALNGANSAAVSAFGEALKTPEAGVPANRLPLLKETADAWYALQRFDQAAPEYEEYFRLAQKQKSEFPAIWARLPETCVSWSHSASLKGDKLRALDILIESRAALGDRPEFQPEFTSIVDELSAADLKTAIGKLTAALPASHPAVARAKFDLGTVYEYGRGVPQDYAAARRYYEDAAEAGDAWSMTNLGDLYDQGLGVPKDHAQARQWYEKAAVGGDALAMRNLAFLYADGNGVPQDYGMARQWYEKAAAAGDAASMTELGILYQNARGVREDYALARQWYEKAATAGDSWGMTNLGVLYEDGLGGVPQDYNRAREWFEKGAAAGDKLAMRDLGSLFEKGLGIPRDYAAARQWYEKAAAAADGPSMTSLGLLYEKGLGVQKDNALARQWYKKAAAAGEADAQKKADSLPR